MKGIAIIFPVFNGLHFTQKCLTSLFHQHNIESKETNIEVVLVDDGSTDGTGEWVSANYPQVHLLKGDGSLWWSGGVNMGIRFVLNELDSDFIVWWNNDIEAEHDYFDVLIHELKKLNDEKIILGSKILLAQQRDIIWSMGGKFDIHTGWKSMVGSGSLDGDDFKQPVEADWLPGMGTITHRSVYNQIGFLDEKMFPQYHGDSDFTLRAKLRGYSVRVLPVLRIYNDNTHSGVKHEMILKKLIQSLFTIRSNYNIKKDILFYRRFTTSVFAYKILFEKYFRYIGGFIKWKMLSLLGIKRGA